MVSYISRELLKHSTKGLSPVISKKAISYLEKYSQIYKTSEENSPQIMKDLHIEKSTIWRSNDLIQMDGPDLKDPVNSDAVKMYYA